MSSTPENSGILQTVQKVRTIQTRFGPDFDFEGEMNECLSQGWLLLAVPSESFPSFVVGWNREGEPPQTEWQKKIAVYKL